MRQRGQNVEGNGGTLSLLNEDFQLKRPTQNPALFIAVYIKYSYSKIPVYNLTGGL